MVFDEAEWLARAVCEREGGNWDRDNSRHAYYYAKAELELAQKLPSPSVWQAAAVAGLCLVGGLGVMAWAWGIV